MPRTFAAALGIPGVTVAQAVGILVDLKFTGPEPTITRVGLLMRHWNPDGTRWMTFAKIAEHFGLSISTVQNEHAAILRRLREHLEGQPPTPTEVSGVGGQA